MNKLITMLVVSVLTTFAAVADSGTCDKGCNCNSCDCGSNCVGVADGFAAAGDLLLVRPLAAAATIGGFGIFAVASPFAAMADAVPEVWDTLVQKPGEYAFDRDLGDWSK